MRIAIVGRTPICVPTQMIAASSRIGTTMKAMTSRITTMSRPRLGGRRRGSGEGDLDRDAREAVEPDHLDEALDLGARAADPQAPVAQAQVAREHRQVDH